MSMLCPNCKSKANCVDSRGQTKGVRRRYKCPDCDEKWTTFETIVTTGTDTRKIIIDRDKEDQAFKKKIRSHILVLFDLIK